MLVRDLNGSAISKRLSFCGKRDHVARVEARNNFDHSVSGVIADFDFRFLNDLALNEEGFIDTERITQGVFRYKQRLVEFPGTEARFDEESRLQKSYGVCQERFNFKRAVLWIDRWVDAGHFARKCFLRVRFDRNADRIADVDQFGHLL